MNNANLIFDSNSSWQKYLNDYKMSHTSVSPLSPVGESSYDIFISGILYNIRSGEIDYCYAASQVLDLLKFEPRLESRYIPKDNYFMVWLKAI